MILLILEDLDLDDYRTTSHWSDTSRLYIDFFLAIYLLHYWYSFQPIMVFYVHQILFNYTAPRVIVTCETLDNFR